MAHIPAPIDIETFATAPEFLNLKPHPKQLEVLKGIFDQDNQRIIVCCGSAVAGAQARVGSLASLSSMQP
jgi:hypothetical protein